MMKSLLIAGLGVVLSLVIISRTDIPILDKMLLMFLISVAFGWAGATQNYVESAYKLARHANQISREALDAANAAEAESSRYRALLSRMQPTDYDEHPRTRKN